MANSIMQAQLSPRKKYEQKYKSSRMNLLLVVIITAINLLLLVTNRDTYFLFSAFIPYFIAGLGMYVCGRFPDEYYADGISSMPFLHDSIFFIALAVSIALTLLYLLAWFLSNKNRVGWLIFALVFFSIDTLGMLLINGVSLDSIFDILFHAWVIYYLVIGIISHYKLKKLPAAEITALPSENVSENIGEEGECNGPDNTPPSDSPVLRTADKEVKHRVLLEVRVLNYDICYRRVKHTNELVIDGNVYDEFEGIIEPAHTLAATVGGHRVEAAFNGTHSLITVDGKTEAKKLRLV